MIPDSPTCGPGRWGGPSRRRGFVRGVVPLLLALVSLAIGGCSRDAGMEAIESDANGYYCRQCQAKMFTERRVFLEDCPKCRQNALVDVVGYWCETDQHLTIRPNIPGATGANVCEKCGVALKNAMVTPRKKDLQTWGAVATELPPTR